jgi:hypothetical protein
MSRLAFVCYALNGEPLDDLRQRLDLITLGAADAGVKAYAHVRDAQNWSFRRSPARDVLSTVFARIAASDVVLLDLTTGADSKRVGLNIEAGYAKGIGKPIVAIWHVSDRPNMTTDLADLEGSYNRVDDLRGVVRDLLFKIDFPVA